MARALHRLPGRRFIPEVWLRNGSYLYGHVLSDDNAAADASRPIALHDNRAHKRKGAASVRVTVPSSTSNPSRFSPPIPPTMFCAPSVTAALLYLAVVTTHIQRVVEKIIHPTVTVR